MGDILLWYESLDALQQVFWGCAAVSSMLFIAQTVMVLIGIDGTDVDLDTNTLDLGGGLSMLSIKNLVNFFLGFGWAGVSLGDVIESKIWLVIVSVLVGVFFVVLFVLIYKKMLRLESNGAFDVRACVNLMGEVYLRIPAEKSGVGKVQISVQGSIHELDAMTEGEALASGVKVRVLEVLGGSTLLVTRM